MHGNSKENNPAINWHVLVVLLPSILITGVLSALTGWALFYYCRLPFLSSIANELMK